MRSDSIFSAHERAVSQWICTHIHTHTSNITAVLAACTATPILVHTSVLLVISPVPSSRTSSPVVHPDTSESSRAACVCACVCVCVCGHELVALLCIQIPVNLPEPPVYVRVCVCVCVVTN